MAGSLKEISSSVNGFRGISRDKRDKHGIASGESDLIISIFVFSNSLHSKNIKPSAY
jgi:hypothetical protein